MLWRRQPDTSNAGRRVALLVFIALLARGSAVCYAQASPGEYQVKSTCLVKFLPFVVWPKGALKSNEPYIVGVLGEDVYGRDLDDAAKGGVGGRGIVLKRGKTLNDIGNCHVVVISPKLSDKERDAALAQLKQDKTLTVGDAPGFVQNGGMIEMSIINKKISFDINNTVAKQTGLTIHANLLKLAKSVI